MRLSPQSPRASANSVRRNGSPPVVAYGRACPCRDAVDSPSDARCCRCSGTLPNCCGPADVKLKPRPSSQPYPVQLRVVCCRSLAARCVCCGQFNFPGASRASNRRNTSFAQLVTRVIHLGMSPASFPPPQPLAAVFLPHSYIIVIIFIRIC
ncbi:hypothetical protein KCP73_01485 [Salmonella enterica subsp. enterica]|nr:hypothetical protein KCP73_01485 [Salmonella enterica subsp. enterica]